MFYLHVGPIFPTVGNSDVLPVYGAYFPNSWEIWCFTWIWSLFSQQLGNLMFYLHMEPIFPTVGKSDALPAYGAYFPNSWEIWCFTWIWSLFPNSWEIWCFTCMWSLFSQQLRNLMLYLNMGPIFPTVGKSDVLPAYGAYFPNSWEIWCFTWIWSLFSQQLGNLMFYLHMEPIFQCLVLCFRYAWVSGQTWHPCADQSLLFICVHLNITQLSCDLSFVHLLEWKRQSHLRVQWFSWKVINNRAVLGFDSSWFGNVLACFRTRFEFQNQGCCASLSSFDPKPFRWKSGWTKSCMTCREKHPRSSNDPPRSSKDLPGPSIARSCLPEALSGVASPRWLMHRQTLQMSKMLV